MLSNVARRHADTIDVDKGFRRAGIGLEMVRLAYVYNGAPIIPPATYYADKEKRNTMMKGQRLGYVTEFPDRLNDGGDRDQPFRAGLKSDQRWLVRRLPQSTSLRHPLFRRPRPCCALVARI
jgi:hypothetical protein